MATSRVKTRKHATHIMAQKQKRRASEKEKAAEAGKKAKRHDRKNVPMEKGGLKVFSGQHAAETGSYMDVEDFLLDRAINWDAKTHTCVPIHLIIYNSAPSMKSFGYKYGYSLGKMAFEKIGGSADKMDKLMEFAGIGKLLYYPMGNEIVIRAIENSGSRLDIKMNAHVLEAGIIAGYLSEKTGSGTFVEERKCIFNGAERCEFVARPGTPAVNYPESNEFYSKELMQIARAFNSLKCPEHGPAGNPYEALSIMPITKNAIAQNVSDLLFAFGSVAAENSGHVELEDEIFALACSIGVKMQSNINIKGRKVLSIKYDYYNSNNGFVDLSSKMLEGFVEKKIHSGITIEKRLERDKTYVVNFRSMKVLQ